MYDTEVISTERRRSQQSALEALNDIRHSVLRKYLGEETGFSILMCWSIDDMQSEQLLHSCIHCHNPKDAALIRLHIQCIYM